VEVARGPHDRVALANGRFRRSAYERMQGTVWNTGCASWYLDATGRNSMLWPDWTWRFRQRTASFDPADFTLTQRTPGNADLARRGRWPSPLGEVSARAPAC
jgi:hypothetical protein